MVKRILSILILLVLAGCGSTLKDSWTNFRAYYNTYYNAEKNYKAGLRKVENQEREINAYDPLQIHPEPIKAGDKEFEKAIEKGARMLRKFPDSKWIDETLGLIGKSYYYRQEYFSALKKFEEQYELTDNPGIRQQAVIWKGKTLLHLQEFEEGIDFLSTEYDENGEKWDRRTKAEVLILLAEHTLNSRGEAEWPQIVNYVENALTFLPTGSLKAKTYFLYGQLLEAQERYSEAAFAYSQVEGNFPEFELLYWAKMRKAEALRALGNLDEALVLFESMRKDDKNVQRINDIIFQIARTEEEREHFEEAVRLYNKVLHGSNALSTQKLRGNSYYRLGHIYSHHLNNFQKAAAYYDSSRTLVRSSTGNLLADASHSAAEVESYGRYASLRQNVTRIDSLLWLGSLPPEKLDSVLTAIQLKRKKEEKRDTQKKSGSEVISNLDRAENGSSSDRNTRYGFLNHRNAQKLSEARNHFKAIWGDRPLADNWRRSEAIAGSRSQESRVNAAPQNNVETDETAKAGIDPGNIPFSEVQKEELRDELAKTRFELGNLYLLNLEQPDSASYYFEKVVKNHPEHSLVPKALYSLFEIYYSTGRHSVAGKYAEQLRTRYPDSEYTVYLDKRVGTEQPDSSKTAGEDLRAKISAILGSSSLSELEAAETLRTTALAHADVSEAPYAHLEAINRYIGLARKDSSGQALSASKEDSISRNVTDPDRIAVSEEPDFKGGYWDSVRVVLKEHRKFFAEKPTKKRIEQLADIMNVDINTEKFTCRELGVSLRIKPGLDAFMEKVAYQKRGHEMNTAESIDYEFVIRTSGEILSYDLLTQNVDSGIETPLRNAINAHLEFEPIQTDKAVDKLRCRVSFPVRR